MMTYLQATCNTHLPRLQTLATATWLELSYGRIRQLGATVDSHHGGLDQEDLDQNDLDYDPWPAHYSLSDPSVVSFLFQTLKTNGWKGLTYHCVPGGEKKESHSPFFREKQLRWGLPIIGQFPLLGASHYWPIPIIGEFPLLGSSHYWAIPIIGEFIFSISWRSVGPPLSQGLGSHQTVECLVNIDPSLKIIF